ncbi:trimeric intracellular cation channel family protein [Ruicaihuangia caeni]|uniref:Trimeric intracellular cation channel family protein n=1 Tax=Ruicaihuangia caeni TaxID=3042517 RepID=A0AAW6T8F0_9MICO|nr:trimeric intracellular cation channel family protein [Klugiella sp. YN-L-19]MDI2097412.1 trimeric intracellular cation channel family protein [Klugiella sp. YN-L-19]
MDDTVVAALRVLDLIGVFANAMLGAVIARSARLDPLGSATLAVMSGLGGGMIRDVLLQHGPPVALTDYAYVPTALAAAFVVYLVKIEGPIWDRVWPYIDALALGCWAAAGAQKALAVGLGWLPAVLLGAVTAVGGGFTRDVVLRRVPTILGGNTLYATCALLAGAVMVVFFELGMPVVGSVVATLVGGALCLLARWQQWTLPQSDEWSALGAARARLARSSRSRGSRRRGTEDEGDGGAAVPRG